MVACRNVVLLESLGLAQSKPPIIRPKNYSNEYFKYLGILTRRSFFKALFISAHFMRLSALTISGLRFFPISIKNTSLSPPTYTCAVQIDSHSYEVLTSLCTTTCIYIWWLIIFFIYLTHVPHAMSSSHFICHLSVTINLNHKPGNIVGTLLLRVTQL